ncbi:MAG: hypothetical protein WDZ75_01750 [Candidatus Paceibacterota bacterium]
MTVCYYTSNHAPEKFLQKNQEVLLRAIGELPLISVSQKPMDFGTNICVGEIGRSHLNIYRQALIGAKAADTKYVAFCEDDVLYSKDHFDFVPQDGCFAYDMNIWAFYTFYRPRCFTYKERINFNGLLCERDLFIEAIEERFKKYPDDSKTPIARWAEPSKYEKQLGVTERKRQTYMATTPSVAFYHPTALSYLHLGRRKRIGVNNRLELPPWGTAEEMLTWYNT